MDHSEGGSSTGYGFAHLALRLGIARPLVLGGAVLYGVSALANLLAGTTNGFVVPRLASDRVFPGQIELLWEMNQALVELAVLTGGTALVLWGSAFSRHEGALARLIFFAGLPMGAVPPALLLAGVIRMDLHGALLAYGLQAVWGALVGWALLRGHPRQREMSV